jgi:hypothetical protein
MPIDQIYLKSNPLESQSPLHLLTGKANTRNPKKVFSPNSVSDPKLAETKKKIMTSTVWDDSMDPTGWYIILHILNKL